VSHASKYTNVSHLIKSHGYYGLFNKMIDTALLVAYDAP
jgi:hypothetical protein